MRSATGFLVPLALAFIGIGCARAPGPSQGWLRGQGGIVPGYEKSRLDRTAALLGPCVGRRLVIRVVAAEPPCAYSFPNGSIFITQGLIDWLDDAELAAVTAHELGHLLDGRHCRAVVSVRGCDEDLDGETRADLLGTQLLGASGSDPGAMIRMLKKIQSCDKVPASCRSAIEHRVSELETRQGVIRTEASERSP